MLQRCNALISQWLNENLNSLWKIIYLHLWILINEYREDIKFPSVLIFMPWNPLLNQKMVNDFINIGEVYLWNY